MLSSFVISAPKSGSGKTTFSLGLMRALQREGLDVRPFKCGPDYIDTHFHTMATDNDSINLDTFMSSDGHVKNLYQKYSVGGDICIVEGAMGMYDGYDKMKGSCGDIAQLLGLPVVLVMDATATAYSVAAIIYGFKNFRPDIKLAGVVFNRVASPSHYKFLLDASRDAGVECFGYLMRNNGLQTPSRHLGLTLTGKEEMNAYIDNATDMVSATVDVARLLEATNTIIPQHYNTPIETTTTKPKLSIAVARDDAFNFIYRANIDALRIHSRYNVEITYFSPISDKSMPDADILYFPGGYPELYSKELSKNQEMRRSIHDFAEAGGHIFGECGGMIYLGESIDSDDMCGILPLKVSMKDAKLTLGYRTVKIGDSSFGGHEFHYSKVVDDKGLVSIGKQFNAKGEAVATPIYRYKNCIAGYTHLYWGDKDLLRLWDL